MKRTIVVFITGFLLVTSFAHASEVFLMLVNKNKGKVYRMKTDNQVRRPLGYFFACDAADDFYIDNFKDFRMLRCEQTEFSNKCESSIFRQVNDSEIKNKKLLIHNDQRNQLIEGSLAMPVFCHRSYPLGAGPGVPVKAEIALNSIAENILQTIDNKQWYRIPNGSWYRTWLKPQHNEDGYLVYYDEWREQPLEIKESFWRGEFPGKAVERGVFELSSKSLFRIAVNENLQINPQFPSKFTVARTNERFSSFFKPGKNLNKGELLLYSWEKNEPGKFEVIGSDDNFSKAFESISSHKRFAAIGHKKIFVIGSDILKKWLYEAGIDNEKAESTLACFKEGADGKSVLVAVYSEPDSTLFKFRYNEELNVLDPNVVSIKLDLKPDAISFDKNANLLVAAVEENEVEFFKNVQPGYEVETTYFNSEVPLGKFSEEKNAYVDVNIPEALDGGFIFSQGYHENLYLVDKNTSKFSLLHSINLKKNYFCREFTLYNASEKVLGMDYEELMKVARKSGNYLSEIKTEVPDFPDQFKKPEKVFIATF
ncbi:MAG: hypothetical protein ACQETH_08440 [Candidatus Rifleibacteriota bacterium]